MSKGRRKTVPLEYKAILAALKARRAALNKRLKEERAAQAMLKYKSRHVRYKVSPHLARIGWFLDRKGEVEITISYLEGALTRQAYITCLAGDALDALLCGVGNMKLSRSNS